MAALTILTSIKNYRKSYNLKNVRTILLQAILMDLIVQYLLLIIMQQISQKSKLSPLFVDAECVPAKMHHLTVINTSVSPIPTVLPYQDDAVTIQDLKLQISRIIPSQSMIHLEQQNLEEDVFETGKEKGASSLKEIKFKEGRHRIDGDEVLCTSETQVNLEQILRKKAEEGRERCDLCCIMLANKSDVIHLSLQWNSEQETQLKILQQVNELYGVELSVDDIKFHRITFECNTADGLTSIRYQQKQASTLHRIIFQTEGLAFVGITIITNRFSMASHIKKEEKQPKPRLIEIILNQVQAYKIDFDRIKQYQTKQLLGIFSVKDPETKGLKIMGDIYEPDRSLQDLQQIYNRAMFNHLTAELAQQFEVFIEGVNKSPALTSNQLKRLQDDSMRMEKVSFRQLGKSKLTKEITPLSLFNSNCQVHSQKDTSFKLLYHIIHRFIRNYFTHFNSFFDDSISSRFVRGLYEQLKNLPVYQGQAWRRIGYELLTLEEQTITFNNFLIASKRDDLLQMEIYPARGCKETFLKIFSVTGRVVGSHTSFEKLQQIIFQPFTKFKVTQRLEDQKTIYLTLCQVVEQPRLMRTGIILWVDDKLKEGKEIFRHIKMHQNSFLLYQLASTAQLAQWIKDNDKLIASQSCNIIMISNMRRIEEGKQNNVAGIDSLRVIRSSVPDCKSILYIGNIQNTKANLIKNQIDPNSLFITNTSNSLMKYLVQCLQPKPTTKESSQQKMEKQNMQQLLQFIKLNQSHNPFVIVNEATINEEKALYKKLVQSSAIAKKEAEPLIKKTVFPALGKKMEITQKKEVINKAKHMSQILGDQEDQPHPIAEAQWKQLELQSKLKVPKKKIDDII